MSGLPDAYAKGFRNGLGSYAGTGAEFLEEGIG
jgi:hypothetical protein